MRKRSLIFATVLCLLAGFFGVVAVEAEGESKTELSEEKLAEIQNNCDTIHVNLKKVQRDDSRVRVFLGEYYEKILENFITPLNVRLVENNLSNAGLVENQNGFSEARNLFINDYVNYQKELEELVAMNCEKPQEFYNKIETVRQKRKIVEQDTLKLRTLISEHLKLIKSLKKEL